MLSARVTQCDQASGVLVFDSSTRQRRGQMGWYLQPIDHPDFFSLLLCFPCSFDHLSPNPPLSWHSLTVVFLTFYRPFMWRTWTDVRILRSAWRSYCWVWLALWARGYWGSIHLHFFSLTLNLSLCPWKQGCSGPVPRPDCLKGQWSEILGSRFGLQKMLNAFWVDSTFNIL